MNGLFLNLPYKDKVVRRYNCSYNASTFLLPPYELICLASIFRDYHDGNLCFIDAIAENRDLASVIDEAREFGPYFITTIAGVDFLEEDIISIEEIKKQLPDVKIILFGYYAGMFSEEIMAKTNIDFIIQGEPDLIFQDLINHLNGQKDIDSIKGLTYNKNGKIVRLEEARRIPNPNELPMPAYDLLNYKYYSEPFFSKPYAILQSARGCPYSCNYCVKTFGTKLTALSPENIFHQVKHLALSQKIESYRFIDDTFTAIPKRVIEFCKLIIENKLSYIKWSCFSRADTLNREMLEYMKMAGCSRIYFGMESGSEKVLNYYNKNYAIDEAINDIVYCKKLGFETIGLFMVGSPIETKQDLFDSIQLAKNCQFDFITVFQFMMYPGTEIFDKNKDEIVFSILPYKNMFKDESITAKASLHKKIFFKRFYFRLTTLKTIIRTIQKNGIREVLVTTFSFLRYLFLNNKKLKRNDYI